MESRTLYNGYITGQDADGARFVLFFCFYVGAFALNSDLFLMYNAVQKNRIE